MRLALLLKERAIWVWGVVLHACQLYLEPLRANPPYEGAARRSNHRFFRVGLLVVASVGGVLGGAQFLLPPPYGERIATGTAEWRSLILDDGSVLHVQPDTEMSVRYDAESRRLFLEHGEVFAEVASEPTRPFEIITAVGKARAVGTHFGMVHSTPDDARIVVTEGTVIATPRRGRVEETDRQLPVHAGKAALLAGGQIRVVAAVDPRRLILDKGTLTINGATIGEAAARLSVRGQPKIVVDDPQVAAIVIPSQVLDGYNPRRFAAKLAASSNIVVEERDGVIHLRSRQRECANWLRCGGSR
jgi:transmembrane sensor